MTRQWQLMHDAQTFLDASKLANDALMGIHFVRIARQRGKPVNPPHVEKIDKGIKLLETILQTLEAREKHETISSEAISILYALSQGRMIGKPASLKKVLKDSITELLKFKEGKIEDFEEAEELLEIITKHTSEEALKATSKVRVFIAEAR